jgi:hypothetical protein
MCFNPWFSHHLCNNQKFENLKFLFHWVLNIIFETFHAQSHLFLVNVKIYLQIEWFWFQLVTTVIMACHVYICSTFQLELLLKHEKEYFHKGFRFRFRK